MPVGLHNTTKNQSKHYAGNFKDRKREEELTEETTGATAPPWKQAGGLPQDQKVVKEWSGKTNNGSVRRKTFELRPAAASNAVNNIRRNTSTAEGKKTRRTVEIVGDLLVKDIQTYKIFHISYISCLNLLRKVAHRHKPFFKGPSDKNLITIYS